MTADTWTREDEARYCYAMRQRERQHRIRKRFWLATAAALLTLWTLLLWNT